MTVKPVHNWRGVLRCAWSIRLMILAGLLSGVEAILPLLDGVLPIPPGIFAVLTLKPKHYKCPVNTRLSAPYSHLEQKLKNVFDLEDVSINDTDRTASIREIVNDYAVPFLRKMDGLSNIKRSIDDGTYPQGLITRKLRDTLAQQ
jgi:hypothetical protein